MALPYELFLALRYLRFHRGRTFLSIITLISVAGVTVGTAALVIALSLMAGFVNDVRGRIYSGNAHLTVMDADVGPGFDHAPALVEQVLRSDGVVAAAPVLYLRGLLSADELGTQGFVELHGIDPAGHARVIFGDDARAAEPFLRLAGRDAAARPAIVLGHELAANLGLGPGDVVRLVVPELTLAPWGAVPRSQVFEIVGTYSSDHFQEDALRAYVALDAARHLVRRPEETSWIEVRVNDLASLETIKAGLRQALSPQWIVVDLIEANQDLLRAVNTEKLILFLAIGLIVVVAALNIVSTLILMVTDKIKEIGALTALGARPAGIATVFMLQGLTIGFVGTLAGLSLGWGLSYWLDRYRVIPLDPQVYYLAFVPFDTKPVDLAFVAALALAISFCATLYPAFKAARLDPLDALRHE